MTAGHIIELMSKDKKIKDICYNVCEGKAIHKDVYQELFVRVCSQPSEKIEGIYSSGYLYKWVVTVCSNLVIDHYRKNSRYTDLEIDIPDSEEYNHNIDVTVKRVEEEFGKFDEYERNLFIEYLKAGSYRKLEKRTGIFYSTICKTVTGMKKQIHEAIYEDIRRLQ